MSNKNKDAILSGGDLRDAPQHRQGFVIKYKPSDHVKIHIYYSEPLAARNL